MVWLEKWNEEIVGRFNRKASESMTEGWINNKAEGKFGTVTAAFETVIGSRGRIEPTGICAACLRLDKINHPLKATLGYELKNMLFGRSYDFTVESDFFLSKVSAGKEPTNGFDNVPMENFQIVLDYGGGFSVKKAFFSVRKGGEFARLATEKLNMPLILERVLRLGLVTMKLSYVSSENRLRVRFVTMKGSATWCLIPPVFQLIPIKERDCIDMIELLQLVAHAFAKQQQ